MHFELKNVISKLFIQCLLFIQFPLVNKLLPRPYGLNILVPVSSGQNP